MWPKYMGVSNIYCIINLLKKKKNNFQRELCNEVTSGLLHISLTIALEVTNKPCMCYSSVLYFVSLLF